MLMYYALFFFFFFNDTATTEIYTLSLHDALPIYHNLCYMNLIHNPAGRHPDTVGVGSPPDA